jgi:hypothetical protein
MRRRSVSLTPEHERAIEEFSQPGPYRDEVVAWARSRGLPGRSDSESLLLTVLIDAGIEHFRTRSVEVVYTELAGIYVDEGLPHEIRSLRAETEVTGTGVTATGAADDDVAAGERPGDVGGGAAGGAAGGRVGARR